MVGDDMRIDHTGEYLVVDPPGRLSFTWPYTGQRRRGRPQPARAPRT